MREAWMSAVELQREAHAWHLTDIGNAWTEMFHEGLFGKAALIDTVTVSETNRMYRESCYRADSMYVSGDMQQIIQAAATDIPSDLEFHHHNLLCNSGFVVFHEPMLGTDVNGDGIVAKGMLWNKAVVNVIAKDGSTKERAPVVFLWMMTDTWDERDAFNRFITNSETTEKLRELHAPPPSRLVPGHLLIIPFDYQYLAQWPKGDGASMTEDFARFFVALNLVAQQNIAETAQIKTPRAIRRRWDLPPEFMFTLITLRRKKLKLPDDHVPQPVEWSRRWVVRGHWRNQYYSKTDTHDWLYIHEFIKGPEDKPLVVTKQRVFDFRR